MPRYVILEHQWNGVHYDLMLEDPETGDLRTWAIDEEIQANLELPARALPAHRRIYLDYEGPVSRGRGKVTRIDQGRYKARDWTEDRVEVLLQGERFSGVAVLWRLEGEEPETSSSRAWGFRLGKVD